MRFGVPAQCEVLRKCACCPSWVGTLQVPGMGLFWWRLRRDGSNIHTWSVSYCWILHLTLYRSISYVLLVEFSPKYIYDEQSLPELRTRIAFRNEETLRNFWTLISDACHSSRALHMLLSSHRTVLSTQHRYPVMVGYECSMPSYFISYHQVIIVFYQYVYHTRHLVLVPRV